MRKTLITGGGGFVGTNLMRKLRERNASGKVVVLDDETVLMSSSAPQSIALVEDLGYTVIPVQISEFEKLEGCVTCLSIRIR